MLAKLPHVMGALPQSSLSCPSCRREAKEKNRESWYMAYIMDTNEEERAKGKTVEVRLLHIEETHGVANIISWTC